MILISQSNPGEALLNIPKKISELPSQINSLREGTIEAIETTKTIKTINNTNNNPQ